METSLYTDVSTLLRNTTKIKTVFTEENYVPQPYFILGANLRDDVRHTQNCNLLVCLNENWVNVTKSLSLLSPDPIMCFWQFGQNPCIGSVLRLNTNKGHFYSLNSVVTLKFGQGHLNPITSSSRPNNVSLAVWSKSMHWFTRYTADKAHFYSLNSVVTMKIGSRSPNSDQIVYLYIKLGLNPSFGSREAADKLFLVKIWHSKCWWSDLENEDKVTKI